jgi:energy-coupling factor transporter ATP-binding protein EcfA2
MIGTAVQPVYCPPPPENPEATGIPQALIMDLVLRRTYISGLSTLLSLSQTLKLSPLVIEPIFREMRSQQLVEVKGMVGNDYNFSLTQAGRHLAMDRFQISHYAGAAPVSLKQYTRMTKAQAAKVRLDRKILRQALADLVLPDGLIDKLGPAIIGQTSIFLYGPTGSGKTSLAERLLRVYQDAIVVPHAIEVDGQIIQLYDPVLHEPLQMDLTDMDQRWVACRRPCVITGGELVSTMLELRLDETVGVYAAPLQMKANNGVLVIDDFGRQLMSPRELLNRWIVPLDRRVDYLTLKYGVKFQVPFEVLVAFATNLDPRELADEAFLRRLQNKILVDNVDEVLFDEIFRRVMAARNVPYEPDSAEYLRQLCRDHGYIDLRACYPADICNILVSISKYENRPVRSTREDLERATTLYFATV